ncbi:tyrosine-type recombinase/integrase [Planctomicrobium sp. SH527]|uniref:tyrosine-type recombinase/integrase n=1 Tax=Planctomicrobium sp. SH527 TaxID=3448123 RepID=UPI003F5B2D25
MAADNNHPAPMVDVIRWEWRLPPLIRTAGTQASKRFVEFFAAQIRNRNTREAYYRALVDFLAWIEDRNCSLGEIEPIHVAAYVEHLMTVYEPATVKQHLAAIRHCFDWLVTGQVLAINPAAAVRGPKHVVKKGKTPVITAEEARQLFDSIETTTLIGLRDRALIAVMLFTFGRVSPVAGMTVADYYQIGKRSWIRLLEKGGKFHEVPAHHTIVEFLDAYLFAAGHGDTGDTPLFRTARGKTGQLTLEPMSRQDVLRMVKRRAKAAAISDRIGCHTFRATGITVYRSNGGAIEKAQALAGHESPRTTMLYDRSEDEVSLDEVERILI